MCVCCCILCGAAHSQPNGNSAINLGFRFGGTSLAVTQSRGPYELGEKSLFAYRYGAFASYSVMSERLLVIDFEVEAHTNLPTSLKANLSGIPSQGSSRLWQAGIKPAIVGKLKGGRTSRWEFGAGAGLDIRRQIARHSFIVDQTFPNSICLFCFGTPVYGYGTSDIFTTVPVIVFEVAHRPNRRLGVSYGARLEFDAVKRNLTTTELTTSTAAAMGSSSSSFSIWAAIRQRRRVPIGKSIAE